MADVRQLHEAAIVKAMKELVKKQHEAATAKKSAKPSLFQRIKAQIVEGFRPKVNILRTHIRYEQDVPVDDTHGFAVGLIIKDMCAPCARRARVLHAPTMHRPDTPPPTRLLRRASDAPPTRLRRASDAFAPARRRAARRYATTARTTTRARRE